MELLESNTVSFIVKVWLEETATESDQATWRGHVTHVSSGERRYLNDLDTITAFIAPYLEARGVRFERPRLARRWLNWWKQRFSMWG